MNLKEVEHFIDRVIPVLIVALGVVLIFEFTTDTTDWEPWISIFDVVVVSFFVTDLALKYRKVKNLSKFLKIYWLDVLAVFPFYLIFRFYQGVSSLALFGEKFIEGQKITHEYVLLREAKVIKEAKAVKLVGRQVEVIERIIRAVQRFLRFIAGRLLVTFGFLRIKH